tara:strand:+ start:6792 stop:7115 length:324 start_codon:yes stop_codon:yes gene_type:complete
MKAQYIKIDDEGKYYYSDKKMTLFHREDGPACEYISGTKAWYLNGDCHRQDGPAIEYTNGTKGWYFYNKNVTQAEHTLLTTHITINGKEFTLAELKALIESAEGKPL